MAKRAKGGIGGFIADKATDLAIAGGGGVICSLVSIWDAVREHVPPYWLPSLGVAAFAVGVIAVAALVKAKRAISPGSWVDPEEHQRLIGKLEEARRELDQEKQDSTRVALAQKVLLEYADASRSINNGTEMNKWMVGAGQLMASTIKAKVVEFRIFRTDQWGSLSDAEKEPLEAVAAHLRGIAINLRPEHLLHSPKRLPIPPIQGAG